MLAQLMAVFDQDPTDFSRVDRKPVRGQEGLVELWGKRTGEGGFTLSGVSADPEFWTVETFRDWLVDAGYSGFEILEESIVEKSLSVGDWAQYAVPKPPGPTTYATGQVTAVSRSGTLTAGNDSVEGTADDPAVKLRVYARREDDFIRTDRVVVRPSSKLRTITKPEGIVEKQIELNEKIRTALRRKVEEHNEKHGDTPSKRATLRMLEAAMRRGIGAYKTNPGSVRPTVTSAEQWGYGRVNGLLYALRTGRFRRTAFDTDLLPKEHRLSTKKSSDDLYPTKEEALRRAEELGCEGFHTHEVDGETVFMPCELMSDYERITGLGHRSSEDLELVYSMEDDPSSATAVAENDLPQVDPFSELYDTATAAEARAILLGITGSHAHEVAGRVRFMPGDSMIDLIEALTEDADPHPLGKAEWSTAYVNDLPDSAFFFVGSGGEKDDDDKTVPRSLRKLPYRNHLGEVDLPHLRNVLARISQTDLPQAERDRIRREARRILEEETREAVEKQKYDSIDFTPPKGVQEAAELGLALRREHGRGGTLIGVARARDLAGGKRMSPETVQRMVSFFARHEVDLDAPKNKDRSHPDYPGAGRIAWLLWGGDPGRRWALKVQAQMRREDVSKSLTIGDEFEDLIAAAPSQGDRTSVDGLIGLSESVVTIIPKGDRYILAKSGAVTSIQPEPITEDAQIRLYRICRTLPEGSAAEVLLDPQGRSYGLDGLMIGGADLRGLSYPVRKMVVDTIGEAIGIGVLDAALVRSGSEMVFTLREMSEGVRSGMAEIRSLTSDHGSHLELELETERANLWKYVSPTVSNDPRALIVSGAPNRVESIRGVPLSGPDGFTFRKSYLPRLGLELDQVSIVHACPQNEGDPGEWSEWLHDFVESHPEVPIIALGKSASACLGSLPHSVLPHPRAIRRRGDRGEVARKSKSIRRAIEKASQKSTEAVFVPISKADEEARIVYGVVLEPHTTDLQGDVLSVDTIENAAHKYLIQHRTVGDNHSRQARAEVVESYLAPADMELGGQMISKGSWVMAVHVIDDALWNAVKSGDYSGFSIGGTGARTKIA